MALTFFGLGIEYRMNLFSEIDALIIHSQGAYSWETIYDMPIWLRKFTMNKAIERVESGKKTKDTVEQTRQTIKQAEQMGIVNNRKPDYFTRFDRTGK